VAPVRARRRDEHVSGTRLLPTPLELARQIPVANDLSEFIVESRTILRGLLAGTDDRTLVIVGPCSVDDPDAAMEYARRLRDVSREVSDVLYVAMRVYFEKPRTTVGWRGLINDPRLDGSGDLPDGLRIARRLLVDILQLGLPTATEFLEPVIPQYLADVVCWAAIGARTTESPTHRQMASGLSMPVGIKNGTDGSLTIALDAMVAAAAPHHFLGIDPDGRVAVIETTGNPDRHLVLRGGGVGPNHDPASIRGACAALKRRDLPRRILVDCSHGNSGKDPRRQPLVVEDLLAQMEKGERSILGWMIESYLEEGRQNVGADPGARRFGVSVTDACLGWDDTVELLQRTAERLRPEPRN
jgi:3-deoxy-7-phosphoheptulonate synthase